MNRQIFYVLGFLCFLVGVFTACINQEPKSNDPRGENYAGSASCQDCHKKISGSYHATAHSLSSLPASATAIRGSFNTDSNTLYYKPALKVAMEKTDSGFYQVAYVNEVEKQAARFDIVIGSGRKGQSYLYWFDDNLYQLPVSYYVPEHKWVNSPGYPPATVLFNRSIPVGCFECHSSYIDKTATRPVGRDLVDHFDKNRIIYGIDCERCHGPAAEHVNFHANNPVEKKPRFIASVARLSRQQQLAMCAVCHSGARQSIASPFNYNPGDSLGHYFPPDTTANTIPVDVHGNQYQLLTASKCFLQAHTITCSTCHNTHLNERDNVRAFSSRCSSCHKAPKHQGFEINTLAATTLSANCIDCHMPARPSQVITMTSAANRPVVPALVRTHLIAIYPEATAAFLKNAAEKKPGK
jgi:hypothetical protein